MYVVPYLIPNEGRSRLLVRDSQQRNVTHLRSTIPSPRPVGRAPFRQICVQPAHSALQARQCDPSSLGGRRPDRGRRGPGRSLQRGRLFHPHTQTHPHGPGRTRRGRRNRSADRPTPRRRSVGTSSSPLKRGSGGFGPPLHRQPPHCPAHPTVVRWGSARLTQTTPPSALSPLPSFSFHLYRQVEA